MKFTKKATGTGAPPTSHSEDSTSEHIHAAGSSDAQDQGTISGNPAASQELKSGRTVLLRLPAVLQRLGNISRAALYARLNEKSKHFDEDLPRPVNFFPGGRAVFWIEAEIDAYIEKRVVKMRAEGKS